MVPESSISLPPLSSHDVNDSHDILSPLLSQTTLIYSASSHSNNSTSKSNNSLNSDPIQLTSPNIDSIPGLRNSTWPIRPSSILKNFVGGYIPHRDVQNPPGSENDSESLSFNVAQTLTDTKSDLSMKHDENCLLAMAVDSYDTWESLAFSVCASPSDPKHYNQAKNDENLVIAMEKEIQALENNDTWDLTVLHEDKKAIGSKWIYRTKLSPDYSIDKHKARLVAIGYQQVEGRDFTQTFSPVAKLATIRIV